MEGGQQRRCEVFAEADEDGICFGKTQLLDCGAVGDVGDDGFIEFFFERFDQVLVDVDAGHAATILGQTHGQCAAKRAESQHKEMLLRICH